MKKNVKITLLVVGALATIGMGYFIYKKSQGKDTEEGLSEAEKTEMISKLNRMKRVWENRPASASGENIMKAITEKAALLSAELTKQGEKLVVTNGRYSIQKA